MGERQFGPYRLVRQIAVGGMAEIHLAKTKGIAGFEKYVALKMIHPNFAEDDQFIQMLVDEAKIAVQLNHGNIAQTFDLGRVGDTYYITMEFVDGADLYKILRRASEIDREMPLDVVAFVGKEMASALDHAHRKRDHTGKSLGIVHRDVSPQNVLISYAGEVKLVDFGIAKATMKARQTAVGVIKGKYYYMSPEQAWGDQIDYRSDIFSAGIVLYEMICGQMLYLEEDLHRLLDMVRKADIKPPSTLRKGVPPMLEKIVMRALAKSAEDRYQSAADLATDLERFLHTYSPVFTAAKVAQLMKQIVGDPQEVPYEIEHRDGNTGTLDPMELVHEKEEIRDENSVIFRVAELKPKQPAPVPRKPASTPPSAARVTRQAEIADLASHPGPVAMPQPRSAAKPRMANDKTREVNPAPWDGESTVDTEGGDDLDNVGERTMITGPSAPGFMMDVASEDGGEATTISAAPEGADEGLDGATIAGVGPPIAADEETSNEDGPTIQRDPVRVRSSPARPAPPALAAKIHAPAVSELRKPRQSRKTPGTGLPASNMLQAIVGSAAAEPMPAPPPARTPRSEDSGATTLPQQPSPAAAAGIAAPLTTPPPGTPVQMVPGVPPHLQPYAMQQPYAPPYGYAPTPPQGAPYAPAPVSPGALYANPMHPFGNVRPQPLSLTGQLRLMEADEIPPQYKVSGGNRWIKLGIAGVIAISVAGLATFFIIKSTRDSTPSVGSVHVESNPPGAEVSYDGQRLSGETPMTIDAIPVGTRHEIKVEFPRHTPYVETVDIPRTGGEVPVSAILKPITGKLVVDSVPDGADVYINGQPRGRTPTTLTDIDMDSVKKLELKLKGYQDYEQNLAWPANGQIAIEAKLVH